MILQRSIRPRAVAPLLKAHTLPSQPRRTFWMPVMNEAQEWTENGIGGLMSPEQFRMAWTDNQGRMVAELNRLTDGTPYSSMSTLSLLVQTARDPDQAQLFNYASMAHNNHFFFKTLSGQPTRPSTRFGTELEEHFSSAASLRATFLASAEAMFAPGFVWLVQNAAATGAGAGNKYAILNTYAAGSPYAAASFRRQPSTAATADNGVVRGQPIVPNVGFLRGAGHNAKTVPGGVDTVPLMCVSTWEHAYLRDFGVAGRRQYLEAWWDHIDWAKVEQHLASNQPTSESWRTV